MAETLTTENAAVCQFCGKVHHSTAACSTVPDEPLTPWEAAEYAAHRRSNNQQLRIEALRAATQLIVASNPNKIDKPTQVTLFAAEQFLRWLETGDS